MSLPTAGAYRRRRFRRYWPAAHRRPTIAELEWFLAVDYDRGTDNHCRSLARRLTASVTPCKVPGGEP
jgi:hypothetical protein